MACNRDTSVLRELAKAVSAIAAKDIQNERRELWRRHNNLERVRPPVLTMAGFIGDEAGMIESKLVCADPFYRDYERVLHSRLLQDTFGDDSIIEPWITLRATLVLPPEGAWGVPIEFNRYQGYSGAFQVRAALKSLDDIDKMIVPSHRIDEARTAEDAERIYDAVGGILEIDIDRTPYWHQWAADISTHLGYFRGHTQMLLDMLDSPDELHALLAFMRDGVLKAQREAEDAGDWSLCSHSNQAMPYVKTLAGPKPNVKAARKELWGFFAAQEFAGVSPELHKEFALQYQMPIMEQFGLVAYGCCEDLTLKIDMLRAIPNLRRISVTPSANVRRCAEQIGSEYVCSYRPNPALVAGEFDANAIGRILREDMRWFRQNGCIVDLCLKDISTVGGDLSRLVKFTALAKKIMEEG